MRDRTERPPLSTNAQINDRPARDAIIEPFLISIVIENADGGAVRRTLRSRVVVRERWVIRDDQLKRLKRDAGQTLAI
jgi:hypothetical protein